MWLFYRGPDMPVELNVKRDVREVNKMLNKLQRTTAPRVIANALNATGKTAKVRAIREATRKLKLPKKVVANRLTLLGTKKAERARLVKANPNKKTVQLFVYMRGIPVFQVANPAPAIGKQRKGGVKAKGGRFYKGAFYAPKRGRMFVFKRISEKRYPVFVPRIGVAKLLDARFTRWTTGGRGRVLFRKNFERLAKYEFQKLNNSGSGRR